MIQLRHATDAHDAGVRQRATDLRRDRRITTSARLRAHTSAHIDDQRRDVDLVVISDVHLGSRACRAEALLEYLRSIRPRQLVLNGDIVDGWVFRRGYWPASHHAVLAALCDFLRDGTDVTYVTGNHDDVLRRYSLLQLAGLKLVDDLELDLAGRRTWILHGDRFDDRCTTPRWLAAVGSVAYDATVLLDNVANPVRRRLGMRAQASAAYFKRALPSVIAHIRAYEDTCAAAAAERGFDAVITGHIHQPNVRSIAGVSYLNCGDWVENCSALEFHDERWRVVGAELAEAPTPVLACEPEMQIA